MSFQPFLYLLDSNHINGLQTARCFLDIVGDRLAFIQGLETFRLDIREMYKNIDPVLT